MNLYISMWYLDGVVKLFLQLQIYIYKEWGMEWYHHFIFPLGKQKNKKQTTEWYINLFLLINEKKKKNLILIKIY